MRFSQGRWAEDILVRTINATNDLRAVPYGPSSVAPADPYEMELYFERLDKASPIGKRPDLLVLPRDGYEAIRPQLDEIGSANLPFTPEADLEFLRSRRNVRRFCGQLETRERLKGFLETAKVPTVIIKQEDLEPLTDWEVNYSIPIFIFHVFYDEAYYISLQEACELIESGVILPTEQTFYAPGGPTTRKYIYKIWYTLAQPLGTMTREPEMQAKFVKDKNGHILPYVHFSGGQMALSPEILAELRSRLG